MFMSSSSESWFNMAISPMKQFESRSMFSVWTASPTFSMASSMKEWNSDTDVIPHVAWKWNFVHDVASMSVSLVRRDNSSLPSCYGSMHEHETLLASVSFKAVFAMPRLCCDTIFWHPFESDGKSANLRGATLSWFGIIMNTESDQVVHEKNNKTLLQIDSMQGRRIIFDWLVQKLVLLDKCFK